MTQFSKWKTIGYAVAIFVAGGVSGGALGVYETKSHLFDPQREQEIAGHWRQRLTDKLGLTPDQVAQINPIIDSGATQLRSIRADTMQRLNIEYDFLPRESEILSLHFWDAARELMIEKGVLY